MSSRLAEALDRSLLRGLARARSYARGELDYSLSLHEEKFTLVSFGELGLGIPDLRKRQLITDSPRILARDDRAAREHGAPEGTTGSPASALDGSALPRSRW